MRILVVDDDDAKIEVMRGKLAASDIADSELETASTAQEARQALRQRHFDLLILDLVLPNRLGDTPSILTSTEFLQDVIDNDIYQKPSHVLGLTAFEEAEISAKQQFSDSLWYILRYDRTSNDWAEPIIRSIRYIQQQERSQSPYNVDLCIVTALRSPELEAVFNLPWEWEPSTPIDDINFARFATFKSDGSDFRVVAACPTRMGMISTALLCAKLIANFRPRFLAMAGICAGVKSKSEIGDVIVGDPTWDWQSGKRTKDKENTQFSIAPHHLGPSEFVRSRMHQLASDKSVWDGIRSGWTGTARSAPRLRIGPMASGSAVLADGQVIEEIRKQHRELIGIEMEAYGLFAAAYNAKFPRPTPLALKSVCDFADDAKSDDFQAYAAYTSAQAVKAFFEKYMSEIHQFAGRS